ncbi:flagellar motor switch protein FliG [Alkalilacustris brevis]|uniref:flagellar motor switch protein FliG n=1 Tax=Alkalilacustris brevis TaxID=2026338 RepID=UPI000E0D8716|nr:FliG C-terminal domain-containing protein [Alkalilacustris brevis]
MNAGAAGEFAGTGAERAEILDAQHPGPRRASQLSGRQKAAIVVRVLLAHGGRLPLTTLPEHVQAALTEQIGTMRLVDRATVQQVVEEFIATLDAAGLAFPGGIDGAITLLDGHISASAASRLRRLAGVGSKTDPWERIARLDAERLAPFLAEEGVEVGAVMLSKLSVARAADLLARLPGEKARRIAHAMARTGRIDPETVRRIGLSLAAQIDAQAHRAFDAGPGERVGAILNSAPSRTREDVLRGLDADAPRFAAEVRRAIFTFVHIPVRIAARDVPRIVRQVADDVLLRALASAGSGSEAERAAAEFLLTHLPQRMAQNLRDEAEELPAVSPHDGEAAMSEVIAAIRALDAEGEITIVTPEDAAA